MNISGSCNLCSTNPTPLPAKKGYILPPKHVWGNSASFPSQHENEPEIIKNNRFKQRFCHDIGIQFFRQSLFFHLVFTIFRIQFP